MGKQIKKPSTCSGPSMYPTLKNGDVVFLEKYDCTEDIKVGDVIIFPHPKDKFSIVHRIIRKTEEGIFAKGDNNNKIDPFVKFSEIKGKVVSAKRNGITLKIHGGGTGLIIHKLMIIRKYIALCFVKPLRILSSLIDKSHIFNFIHPLIHIKIIRMNSKHGVKELLIVNNKVIGSHIGVNSSWKVKFPYKYFINKNKLKADQS